MLKKHKFPNAKNALSPIVITIGLSASSALFAGVVERSILSPKMEMLKIADVGAGAGNPFQGVSFANTYIDPIVVCTYEFPGHTSTTRGAMAATRINNVSSTGFDVTVKPYDSTTEATASNVFCTVAEAGAHSITNQDGTVTKFVAGTVGSTQAQTQRAVNRTYVKGVDITSQSASGLSSGNTPALLAQVMTYENEGYSVAWTSDCVSRAGDPVANTIGRACVGKHISNLPSSTVPNTETIGFIAMDSGSNVTETGVRYQVGKTSDSIKGVADVVSTSQYSTALSNSSTDTYELGVGTEAGADGWHMGQANLYRTDSLADDRIQFVIDDFDRIHTTEPVSFMAASAIGKVDLAIDKSVNTTTPQISETVTFTLTVSNTGEDTATNVVVNDILPAGFTLVQGTLTGGSAQTVTGTDLKWEIDSIASGDEVTLTFQAIVNSI